MRATSALMMSGWFFPYWEMTQSTGTTPEAKMARATPHNSDIIPLAKRLSEEALQPVVMVSSIGKSVSIMMGASKGLQGRFGFAGLEMELE